MLKIQKFDSISKYKGFYSIFTLLVNKRKKILAQGLNSLRV